MESMNASIDAVIVEASFVLLVLINLIQSELISMHSLVVVIKWRISTSVRSSFRELQKN